MPGSIPAASTPEGSIPDWYKVGWRSVSGVDEPRPTSTTAERSLLAEWVSEQSYGTMYHNAGRFNGEGLEFEINRGARL